MNKLIITKAIVSKGYDNAPAIKFNGKEGNAATARFRIGEKQYDSKAENHTRWMNWNIVAYGHMCERVEKMQLKEGSYINLVGRITEETFTEQQSQKEITYPLVILEDIEYAMTGGKKDNEQESTKSETSGNTSGSTKPADAKAQSEGGFEGFQPYGGAPFYDED